MKSDQMPWRKGTPGSRTRSGAVQGEHRTGEDEGEAFTLATGQLGAMRRSGDGTGAQIHRTRAWSTWTELPHQRQHARSRTAERSPAAPAAHFSPARPASA